MPNTHSFVFQVHWEAQIKKLGGPDFAAQGKTADSFGQELSGQAG